MSLMTQPRLSDLAPVLKTTPPALLASLAQQRYRASADDTLERVARASGQQASELLLAVMPAR